MIRHKSFKMAISINIVCYRLFTVKGVNYISAMYTCSSLLFARMKKIYKNWTKSLIAVKFVIPYKQP